MLPISNVSNTLRKIKLITTFCLTIEGEGIRREIASYDSQVDTVTAGLKIQAYEEIWSAAPI
jgi:hypothetical protein